MPSKRPFRKNPAQRQSPAKTGKDLLAKIESGRARVGIVGLGYVGLPLACLFAERGYKVIGFDIDPGKIAKLRVGRSYIRHIPGRRIKPLIAAARLEATSDLRRIGTVDAVLLCVPTPLDRHREPDLRFVVATAEAVARALRPGQLVVLESSTYPGTTREVVKPILEAGGLVSGRDFFLAYSPEREDPGNADFGTAAIPKVVGGDGEMALKMAAALYSAAVVRVVPVGDCETAEAVKLTENIFRSVNIALVNELKVVFAAMGIDVWDVIEAAKTKPFGFMPFYPGPGLGGHCIPIDPFYLAWKARAHGVNTRFIELAGEVNTAMPAHIADILARALSDQHAKALKGARILILGIAYKKNVDDLRESPALAIMELLAARGAMLAYHDPHVLRITPTREYAHLTGRRSTALTAAALARVDAVLIVTDHDAVDYALVVEKAPLVIDTRNVIARKGLKGAHVVKA